MSSDDDDDVFALPGVITKRAEVNVSDVSSDDDEGTFAAIKSGPARKAALEEKQRLKAEKQEAASAAASAAPSSSAPTATPDDDDVVVIEGASSAAGPASKRARRGSSKASPASGSSSKAAGKSPALDPHDKALIAEQSRLAAKSKELQNLKKSFVLDDDDDDDEVEVTKPKRGANKAPAAGGASRGSKSVLFHVLTDGTDAPAVLLVPRDQPIASGDFLRKVALELALVEGRVRLWRDKPGEGGAQAGGSSQVPLDTARSPEQLGLVPAPGAGAAHPVRVWAEEAAEETMKVKLRPHGGGRDIAPIEYDVRAASTFGELVAKYCSGAHGAGLTPARVYLDFDGDAMPPDDTLQEHDVEEDDLFDVKLRG